MRFCQSDFDALKKADACSEAGHLEGFGKAMDEYHELTRAPTMECLAFAMSLREVATTCGCGSHHAWFWPCHSAHPLEETARVTVWATR